jgi:hypothetical protein
MARLTRARQIGLAALAVVAALAVFVATSVGSTSKGYSTSSSFRFDLAVAHIAAGGNYVFETGTGTVSGGHYVQGIIKCPAGHPHPISGLFNTNSTGVFLSASQPRMSGGSNGWLVGVTNTGSSTANVLAGAVCAK